jgi:hypothetical protein
MPDKATALIYKKKRQVKQNYLLQQEVLFQDIIYQYIYDEFD